MSSGHPASFQGPQLPPPTQQQVSLPPGSQLPPSANNVNGLCAQPLLPPMARQDGIPGPVPQNPNLQQLSGQPPGPGYHPQQGKDVCYVIENKTCMENHWWNCDHSQLMFC